MKVIVSFLLLLNLLSLHATAVVYLPRLRVYPNSFRPSMFHEQKPLFSREENRLLVTEKTTSLAGRRHFGVFGSVFLFFSSAVFSPEAAVLAAQEVVFSQIHRLLPSVNTFTAVMAWFSFLGWYP